MDISVVIEDLKRGEQELKDIENGVTIFASSRFKEDSSEYKVAMELGKRLADENYTVITGGSIGLMEALNRGAKLSQKGKSIGLHMSNLPNENKPNAYLDKSLEFHYFFTRKIMLTKYSMAYIILTGGFGTLDEFFEVLNLIRTNNHPPAPIILFGIDYWSKLYNFMEGNMLEYGTINREDLNLISMTNSIDEVMEIISNFS